MKACILIAPVTRLQSMTSPLFLYLRDNDLGFAVFEKMGPEIFTEATASSFID
jgi:hypothetical protein